VAWLWPKTFKTGNCGGLRAIMRFDGSATVYLLMPYRKRRIAQPTDREIREAINELQEAGGDIKG